MTAPPAFTAATAKRLVPGTFFLGTQRRRGNVGQQHFLAGLTDKILECDRRVDRPAKMP
jgi:hypothetical protein